MQKESRHQPMLCALRANIDSSLVTERFRAAKPFRAQILVVLPALGPL